MTKQNFVAARNGFRADVGRRLRTFRTERLKLKCYEMARHIGISQGSLSDIENGNAAPSAQTLANLARHTNINLYWLLHGKGTLCRRKR